MSTKFYFNILLFLFAIAINKTFSQWSSDPNVNLQVSSFGLVPEITSDGNGGVIVVFQDNFGYYSYAQRIDKYGYKKWNNGEPVKIGGAMPYQIVEAVEGDGQGGAFLLYKETNQSWPHEAGEMFWYINKIDSAGNWLWNGQNGIKLNLLYNNNWVNTEWWDRTYEGLVHDGMGGVFFAWVDSVNGATMDSAEVKIQRIDKYGDYAFDFNGKTISASDTSAFESIMSMAGDGDNGFFISYGYMAKRIDYFGNFIWKPNGIQSNIPLKSIQVDMNNSKVSWISKYFHEEDSRVHFLQCNKYNYDGSLIWQKVVQDSLSDNNLFYYHITFNDDTTLITWTNTNFELGVFNIKMKSLNSLGEFLWNGETKTIVSDSILINELKLIKSGPSHSFLTWYRKHEYNTFQLFFNKINSIGEFVFEEKVPITLSHIELGYRVISDGSGGFIAVWDELLGRSGIYVQQVNKKGNLGEVITKIESQSQFSYSNKNLFYELYPNPFNSIIKVRYKLAKAGRVKILIYDLLGKRLKTLIDKRASSGEYHTYWDSRNNLNYPVSSGIYFISFLYENINIASEKIILIQ